jgi:hypothetical protein
MGRLADGVRGLFGFEKSDAKKKLELEHKKARGETNESQEFELREINDKEQPEE